ncbi:hypothetical protein J1792_31660 [Streptomyces triculaminicus]|uniref:Uncharacterized protein n=2 Tax=Streptomyces TaxID=1883 RepID=A0A939JRZ8_9ACTN|nr:MULTISPECIES: hypothetical protein [Streptomyces]MBO0657118.1 hypothetical protein [Streptomyces triculaminicus]QSY49495.1 hypothetical protein J3S04_32130 [Streptomyces griseocarneus]
MRTRHRPIGRLVGALVPSAAAVALSPSRRTATVGIELFGVNSGGSPYHRRQTRIGGPWSGWERFDGLLRP